MPGITLDRLSKRFDAGGSPAVAALSLEIPEGQFGVLVGPSGCGKTTVLRMVAGLEAPSSGRVFIGRHEVTELPPRDRDIAMVFQNYALYPHLNVSENIGFGLRMRRVAAADAARRVRMVAESLGIGQLLARMPAHLSGGQRQRVALARAIVREPAVFLFDEPLSNLDAQIRAQTRAELVRLQRQLGTTVLYVTHDQVEAMTMATRVAVMNAGRLEQVAAPLEVYQAPASLFVASFVGSPSINRLPGRVSDVDGTRRFVGPLAVAVGAPLLEAAILGVRPEHLVIGETAEATKATVVLVESLGPETLVHVRFDGSEEAVARVAGAYSLPIGAVVPVSVDPRHALVFDGMGQLAWPGTR
ncbi:MAG: sn-glycerol-3-phosphate import ATP-binding protein UgpC [Gemmatimonadaceae bacterium]|nr:sn-glycerol-3-phosphate import ATP-binding protein UgpC [Gemmatimonadaceae bacterium]